MFVHLKHLAALNELTDRGSGFAYLGGTKLMSGDGRTKRARRRRFVLDAPRGGTPTRLML